MEFSVGIGGLEAAAGQVEASGRPPRGHFGVRDDRRAGGQRSFRPGMPEDWRDRAKCVRGMPGAYDFDLGACLGRRGSCVMVLGRASAKAGGQTGEDPRRNKGRHADRPAFADRRRPSSIGLEAASPDGRVEAADGRGRRLCAWRDAISRSSGPYAGPWAGRAGESGA
jgi:hypothetical protein